MSTATLVRPQRVEQAAALMLTAFKENPNVVMTRREVESLVNVSEFSKSTRQRALNVLVSEGHICTKSNWPDVYPIATYWLKENTE